MTGTENDASATDGPTPEGPKDAAVANPPSTEAAASDHPPRTPGLGRAVPGDSSDPASDSDPSASEEDS
jgi:hypothetical protein